MEKEKAKEGIHHRYQFLGLVTSRVGVVLLVFLAAAVLKLCWPSYNMLDLVVILSIGATLGAAFLQSRRLVEKRYACRLEEVDGKRIDYEPHVME